MPPDPPYFAALLLAPELRFQLCFVPALFPALFPILSPLPRFPPRPPSPLFGRLLSTLPLKLFWRSMSMFTSLWPQPQEQPPHMAAPQITPAVNATAPQAYGA